MALVMPSAVRFALHDRDHNPKSSYGSPALQNRQRLLCEDGSILEEHAVIDKPMEPGSETSDPRPLIVGASALLEGRCKVDG